MLAGQCAKPIDNSNSNNGSSNNIVGNGSDDSGRNTSIEANDPNISVTVGYDHANTRSTGEVSGLTSVLPTTGTTSSPATAAQTLLQRQ